MLGADGRGGQTYAIMGWKGSRAGGFGAVVVIMGYQGLRMKGREYPKM